MFSSLLSIRTKFVVATLAGAVIAWQGTATKVFAQDKPAQTDANAKKSDDTAAKKQAGTDAKPTATPAKPADKDPHAGHNHGPAMTPTSQKKSDPAAIPTPTVVLKPGEKPDIKFESTVYDFDRKRAGEDVVHDFVFTNTGSGPLELLRVKPSCGCTTAGEYERVIQPGKQGKIPIKIGTTHMSGPIAKTVMVNTNAEGPGAAITLNIKGTLWEIVDVAPRTAYFGRVTREDLDASNKVVNLTLVNNSEKKAKLGQVRSTSEAFTATVRELEPGKKFELTVAAGKNFKAGLNSGNIEVDTGLEEMPKISVPASIFVTADVDVTPEQLPVPQGLMQPIKRSLYIRNNTKDPITLSDLKVSPDKLKATLEETRAGFSYRITVDIPSDYVPGADDKLTIKTSSSKIPTLTVPIVDQGKARQAANSALKPGVVNTATKQPTPPAPKAVPAKPAASEEKPKASH